VLCTLSSEAPSAPNGSRRIPLPHQKHLLTAIKDTLASSTVGTAFALCYLLPASMHTPGTSHSCTPCGTVFPQLTKLDIASPHKYRRASVLLAHEQELQCVLDSSHKEPMQAQQTTLPLKTSCSSDFVSHKHFMHFCGSVLHCAARPL
jgi:hypothetical protein